ncbi:MAG: hypothetical protein D6713_09620 [Deltaproteobacteria bacterium]|nr:MAG: hypothetical protein D6713_09620 [Deltaproteobacteria bacterium]
MKKKMARFGIVIIALMFALSASPADAKREQHEFQLGRAKSFARPFTLIIPIPVNKEGRIGVYAKVHSSDKSLKHPLRFSIVLVPKKGKSKTLASSSYKRGKEGTQVRYEIDSVDLRLAKEILLIIYNYSEKRRATGEVLISYPVQGEESRAGKPIYPDLVVNEIRLGPDCSVEVLLANNGPGRVVPVFWDKKVASLKVYVNGRLWGGAEGLAAIDPNKNLRKVRENAIYRSRHRVKGTETIKAELVVRKPLMDSDEGNNVKTAKLTCAGPPDLAIKSITLTRDCRVRVRVINQGGPIPRALWNSKNAPAIYIYRNGKPWGGQTVARFDGRMNLSRQNGTATYISTFKVKGGEKIRAVIDSNEVVEEKSEVNNALETPLTCR